MTDLFDQQITDGLHRAVDGIAVPRGSFGDVRRRVRARRSRHVAAAVVPAVAGLALIGMRPSGDPDPLSADATTDSSTGSSDPAPATAVTSSTQPTTTSIGGSAISPDLVAGVLCLDATGQSDGLFAGCLEHVPNARTMKAPSAIIIADTPKFLVPLDPAYQVEAETLSDLFGLPVRPDVTAHLQQELAGTDLSGVRVFMVIGTTDAASCTIPGCEIPATSYPPKLTLEVDGWEVAAGDLDDRFVRYNFVHLDGRQLDVTVEAGGVDVYLDRIATLSPDAVETIDDISQVATLATIGGFQLDALLEPGSDWVLQAVGAGFASREDFVATVTALEQSLRTDG